MTLSKRPEVESGGGLATSTAAKNMMPLEQTRDMTVRLFEGLGVPLTRDPEEHHPGPPTYSGRMAVWARNLRTGWQQGAITQGASPRALPATLAVGPEVWQRTSASRPVMGTR